MADRKPIVEIGGELTNLDTSVDELDVPLEKLSDVDPYTGNADTFLAVRDDVTKADWRVTAPASGTSWQYSSSTTMADPGSGFFRLDGAIGAATAMAISTIGRDNGALGVILLSLKVDDLLRIQRTADGASSAIYKVTAAVTDNTTWVQIAITAEFSAGTFANNQSSAVQFYPQAPASGGGGGSPAHVDLNKTTSEIVSTVPIKVLFDDVTITGDVSFFSYAASSGNVVVNKDCIVMMQFEYSFVPDFGSNAPIARAALTIDFVNIGDNDQGIFSTTSKAGISSVSRIKTITTGETLSSYFYSLAEDLETGAGQISMQIWVLEDLS